MLNITLGGDYNDKPLEFTGNVGPYFNLLDGHDVSFSGIGNFGSLQIRGNGVVDDLLQPRQPQFNIEVKGPEIDRVTSTFGFEDLGSGPFSLHAIGNEINDRFLTSIDGDIGDITLSVSAETSDLVDLDELKLEVAINGPSLGAFTRTFGVEKWPDKPFNLSAEVTRNGDTVNIPNLSLSIGGTRFSSMAAASLGRMQWTYSSTRPDSRVPSRGKSVAIPTARMTTPSRV